MLLNIRKPKATSLTELAFALAFLLPLLLVIVDCMVIAICVSINDQTCSEAARVAAANSPDVAFQQARSVVSRTFEAQSHKGMMSDMRLESVVNDLDPAELKVSKLYGGPISGTVTVTTIVEVKPMFIQFIKHYLIFTARATFPYTYIMRASPKDKNTLSQ